jgi:hypothetical protein
MRSASTGYVRCPEIARRREVDGTGQVADQQLATARHGRIEHFFDGHGFAEHVALFGLAVAP